MVILQREEVRWGSEPTERVERELGTVDPSELIVVEQLPTLLDLRPGSIDSSYPAAARRVTLSQDPGPPYR